MPFRSLVLYINGRKKFCPIIGALIVIVFLGFFNIRLTRWVDGESFSEMLNRETSKGLKLDGSYASLKREGLLGVHADSFTGSDGQKTIVTLQADGITGTFNPLGILLRRWELKSIHIASGSVMLQKTEASPEAPPPLPPWWAFRVYLADIKVDDANVLWHLRDKESGLYHTFLEITPNGRDFEYDARGGEFKSPITPYLEIRHAHVLIRKPRLYCSEFILGDDRAHPEQQLRIQGDAGLQQDRSMKVQADMVSLNISPWLPEKMRSHVNGVISGHIDYTNIGTGLETSQGKGGFFVSNGVLHELAPVHQYIALTASPDPGDLRLKTCRADIRWQDGAITLENLDIECEGVFRLTGTVTMRGDQSLNGDLNIGLTDPYLQWLPTARETIFTRNEGPYCFAPVHVSGTIHKPQQDLSERITREVEKTPRLAIKIFLRQAAEWLNFD